MKALQGAVELLREGQVATNEDLKEAILDRAKAIQNLCGDIRDLTNASKDDPGVGDAIDLGTYLCSGISSVIDDATKEYALPAAASLEN